MRRLSLAFIVGVAVGALLSYWLITANVADNSMSTVAASLSSPEPSLEFARTEADSAAVRSVESTEIPNQDVAQLVASLASVDGRQRAAAIQEAARIWASSDPEAALNEIITLQDRRQRAELTQAVLFQWSLRDTAAALEYVGRLNRTFVGSLSLGIGVIQFDPDSDPVRLLELADALPLSAAQLVRSQIVGNEAEKDPARAAALISDLPRADRQAAAHQIAPSYARLDPDGALRWAMQTTMPDLQAAVIGQIAETDPLRAFDLALEIQGGDALGRVIMQSIRSSSLAPEEWASTLMALPNSTQRRLALETLTNSWLQEAPEVGIEWLLSQQNAVPVTSFQNAAHFLSEFPDLAAGYIDRVPDEVRGYWIRTVAARIAETDPEQGLEWVSAYRSQPGYRDAVSAIAGDLARFEPQRAIDLIQTEGLIDNERLVRGVLSQWSVQDPRGAARWVEGAGLGESSASATETIAQNWYRTEPNQAELWVTGRPKGPDRDSGLAIIATLAAESGSDRVESLLDSIDSDSVRQEAATNAALRWIFSDRAAAERLVDRFVTDPALVARFEQAGSLR